MLILNSTLKRLLIVRYNNILNIDKMKLENFTSTDEKRIFIMILLIFTCCFSSYAQKMNTYLHKELLANVGSICEETPDDNPCAGSEIYLSLLFDEKKVEIAEKEISTCGKESISLIGTFNWKLVKNQKIIIDFATEKTKGTYAEKLFLELKQQQLIGSVTHLNGRVIKYVFKEKN